MIEICLHCLVQRVVMASAAVPAWIKCDSPFSGYIKIVQTNGAFNLIFTDLIEVWTEDLDRREFEAKFTRLNPNIEKLSSTLLQFVCDMITGTRKSEYELDRADGSLVLKLKTKSDGLPVHWEVEAVCQGPAAVREFVLEPIFCGMIELQRRNGELCSLLELKDAQIVNYKAQGVEHRRKAMDTKQFLRDEFFTTDDQLTACSTRLETAKKSNFDEALTADWVHTLERDIRNAFTVKKRTTQTKTVDNMDCGEVKDKKAVQKQSPEKTEEQLQDERRKRKAELDRKLAEEAATKATKTKKKGLHL